ncbi:DUF3499 domain-containing protein [Gleimia sp. 6138-11-ORH1]|uniref:DUF3499 domain-containing protein n=1 Tax=Gleimia sp. 6138-11-ORH1 TaxID=2973937 RepID=UPI0021681ADA|nr:DUF3499 domain-containing protein [Gleimia sp. 6138-11-ORH1]MCS4484053.1 DUF3499 domain-containing protein [Gleimia sp. 6138-11-ORH1]
MKAVRDCELTGCTNPAVATLTYNYRESTAVIGPLPAHKQPYTTELCQQHALKFNVPQGWTVIRLEYSSEPPAPSQEDLDTLAKSILETARRVRIEIPHDPRITDR